MKMKKMLTLLLTLCMLVMLLSACSGGKKVARIEMEDGSIIRIELYRDQAPITVDNFEKLVKQGFYDGVSFHRVVDGFVVQGGDPTGTGAGGPGYRIKGEFLANGVKNTLSHTDGVVSMARQSNGYDTAGSQFFICNGDQTFLDGQYAAFGKVIEGMDVVRRIKQDDIMKKVTME